MGVKKADKPDLTTELKIREAARRVFLKKGFAATRTRDIAQEAGINLALLNYYFRSKENLFALIMEDTLWAFLEGISGVINSENTDIRDKVRELASRYIDLILREPDLPFFFISEIRNNSPEFLSRFPIAQRIRESVFFRQYAEEVKAGRISEPNPLQFLMNVLGLIVFPFLGKSILMEISRTGNEEFARLMIERKRLIPVWVDAILKT